MRKRLVRSFVFRFFVVLAIATFCCWCALFLYVNMSESSTRVVAFSLGPFFEGFASRSTNRQDYLAALKREIVPLLPDVADLTKLWSEPSTNNLQKLAGNCTAYQSARFYDFPSCAEKLAWMTDRWTTDACYSELGVRGDTCSVLDYLSTVELVCPPRPQPHDAHKTSIKSAQMYGKSDEAEAEAATSKDRFTLLDFDTAVRALKPPRSGRPTLTWITARIRSNWHFWQHAATQICLDLASNASEIHDSGGLFGGRTRVNTHLNEQLVLDRKPEAELQRVVCGRRRLRVHVHVGSLTRVSGTQIAEMAGHGGPLGELVQWSDLLAGLLVLGHNITITTELDEFAEFMRAVPKWNSPCQDGRFGIDLLYTDIGGLVQLRQHILKGWFDKWKCPLRVLDTFGTEPKFNDHPYATQRSLATTWGRWNMNVKQFFTMFPHTPDNSFMGFVITSSDTNLDQIVQIERDLARRPSGRLTDTNTTHRVRDPRPDEQRTIDGVIDEAHGGTSSRVSNLSVTSRGISGMRLPRRESVMALVYGKTLDIWQGRESYLRVFNDYLVLHATVSGEDTKHVVPSYVLNHGLVDAKQLERLYRSATMFIGLGFPYEGPSPLEAIAHGCVFINPRFEEPLNRDNTPFFAGKPTTRKLSSQHPYMEIYVGEPYVYTVDAANETELRSVIELILTSERPKAYVPFEFTPVGFLERLIFYQSFSSVCPLRNDLSRTTLRNALEFVPWPPASCVKTYLGAPSLSCNDVCLLQNHICEPNHLLLLNFVEVFQNNGIECDDVTRAEEVGYPAVRLTNPLEPLSSFVAAQNSTTSGRLRMSAKCFLQNNDRLFSCAESVPGLRRLCPCRRFRAVRQQTAMC